LQQPQPASVILVLGGVRSGKSRFAQQIAQSAARVTFVATAERRDDAEMHAKIGTAPIVPRRGQRLRSHFIWRGQLAPQANTATFFSSTV
jgi:adenosyl cobinamide kinase/adenosyl cobinamide phosphate guanylyltransferase